MKKVLFAASVFFHFAAFHKPFIKLLLEKGYEVHVAANPEGGRKEEIEELGAVCWDISFSRSPFNIYNTKAFIQLWKLMKEHHFQLIHVHTPVAAFLVRFISNVLKQGNVLYTAHGFHFYKGAPLLNWLVFYNMEKLARFWTDGIIVMNQEDFHNGIKMGFKPNENLFLVHGVGVSRDMYGQKPCSPSLREELSIPSNGVIVTTVAELNENKNHMFLLRNWKQIVKSHPNAYWVIVGEGKHNILLDYILKEDLQNIFLLGYRKDIDHILHSTDIMVLLSKREGLPRAIMEAMITGKSTVASDTRGLRDLVLDGENGFIIPLENDQKLIDGLSSLIQNTNLRELMGQQAMKLIAPFCIENVIKEYELIYIKYLHG